MTNQEFISEIEQVQRFYQKELTQEQKTIWYESLKNIGITRFKYLLSEIYRTSKYFPSLSEVISLDRETGYLPPTEVLKKKVHCDICEGKGFILYYKKEGELTYTFTAKCNCTNATPYMTFPSFNEVGLTEEELRAKRLRQKEKSKNMKIEDVKKQIMKFVRKEV